MPYRESVTWFEAPPLIFRGGASKKTDGVPRKGGAFPPWCCGEATGRRLAVCGTGEWTLTEEIHI